MSINIKRLLVFLARLHPKNRIDHRRAYPQLWYCIPHWIKRSKWLRRCLEAGCGLLTGHELSKTEWGYGGGKMVDHHCRWCDRLIQIPLSESPPPSKVLNDLI